jgi:hypothetical protein
VLTRPTIPDILNLLGRATMDQARVQELSEAAARELFITSQMLAYLARRAELEPSLMLAEIDLYEDLGDQVLGEALGDTDVMARALAELRAHRASQTDSSSGATAYALASEVLCLAIDAAFSATGSVHDAMVNAMRVRRTNQAAIVGDFVIGGR